MTKYLILICEGPHDEAVGGALTERLIGPPGEKWNWESKKEEAKAFFYWQDWKKIASPRQRGTISIPESIRKLKQSRGEALMAIRATHFAQRQIPNAIIILLRDSDGKKEREEAWHVFQQLREDVIVGLAKKSIEAWILACWNPDKKDLDVAKAWVKQNRSSSFDPFQEPDRLRGELNKKLLAHLGCINSEDYSQIIIDTDTKNFQAKPAQRVGLNQFIEQIQSKIVTTKP